MQPMMPEQDRTPFDWRALAIAPDLPFLEAIRKIESGAQQIALVVDGSGRLLGTVSDGDVRRAILSNIPLDSPVSRVMEGSPTTILKDEGRLAALLKMKEKLIRHIPVVDQTGHLIGLETLSDLLHLNLMPNSVLLMAGGLGTRLGDLTRDCPKPLLNVGPKPILEIILENFIEYGFKRFYISLNYKGEMIKEYFGDGSRWGVSIHYIWETQRLGTAGALSLLPEKPQHSLVVMNGDILTRVNFRHMLDFHEQQRAAATMAVKEYSFQVPYGVVRIKDGTRMISLDEKPVQSFFVSAGIYILRPELIELVPRGMPYDMPDLFQALLSQGDQPSVFPVHEYWLDIGQRPDFDRAHTDYYRVFDKSGN
ncbi:nucleotidyltransferase family protein [Fundidesulfovibrio soli]|uniref:nucleotidyltransferase family protein n=1 Tax=Fundidesulfovibrio soli TaxID=2922716 RepID=UPI001FAF8263|nr:nucleotidyltransferase family protein [Fundidesulfovibrio soli]